MLRIRRKQHCCNNSARDSLKKGPRRIDLLRYWKMKQQTHAMLADQSAGFERYRKPTRRDEFLATMNAIVPWPALCDVIAPHYPKGVGGRPPIGLERMLRIHFIQHWFNLADEACEEALYDSASLRRFVDIDLGREPVADATTMLKFRRLLHDNKLGEQLFAKVGGVLQQSGFKLRTGTIVDATIIGAPSATKNAQKARDPEMHQARKGRQWYFGMKLHIGVDSQSGLAHGAVVTAANVRDKHPLPQLLHGAERRVYGDSVYSSQKELIAGKAAGQGLHQPACAQPARRGKRGHSGDKPQQVAHPRPRRACLLRPQATLGLRQGALPRAGQERHASLHRAGAGQHLPRATTADGTGASMIEQCGSKGAQKARCTPSKRQS